MPRTAGQIDQQKREAILDATAQVLSERGLAAPIEVIARVAKVSKQTIYNHYGSKAELVKAMVARRSGMIAETLGLSGAADTLTVLTNFAVALLTPILEMNGPSILRVIILGADGWPGLAAQIYEAGPELAARRLADYLRTVHKTGELDIADAARAASLFIGMVTGRTQLQKLMRAPTQIRANTLRPFAREAAMRFMRAYAPAAA